MNSATKEKTEVKETKPKEAKKYFIELKKNYKPANPDKIKILENGKERDLVGTFSTYNEDGLQTAMAQGEYAKLMGSHKAGKGTVIVVEEKEAKRLVDIKAGALTENW